MARTSSSHTPSNIFVVRHGARLDAADKDWSQSSATPYDTPLTYGGWIQSRNLGVRIATLLQQSAAKDGKQRRIVIHTSPFLRCIQTSTSIASGIAQHHHQQITDAHWVADENGELQFKQPDSDTERFTKPLMRIDSWLGEWMTMDYYTDITPPPVAPILVNSAKNEYMRPQVPIPNSANGSPRLPAIEQRSLPTSLTGGFIPPSPSYAASTSGQIPRGYYSQAKSYVELDHAWNSTMFGEGAEIGEEWSQMHKRFREGYKRLMQYYTSAPQSVNPSPTAAVNFHLKKQGRKSSSDSNQIPSTCGNPTPPLSDSEDGDEDIETVLILVTHGAGCNSLIGALTDKPVLIDIGINSLTWGALRSPQAKDSNNLPAYDLKLTANTEHMRPATPRTATPPISPFLRARPPRNPAGLGGFVLTSSDINHSSLASAMGSVKSNRSASSGSANATRPTGLWTMSRPEERKETKSWFEDPAPFVEGIVALKESEKEEVKVPVERSGCCLEGAEPEVPKPRGLWVARAMDSPMKRRWTVGREAFNGSSD